MNKFYALHFPWKQRLAGVSAAIAIVAASWVPSAQRYGGSLLLPLSSFAPASSWIGSGHSDQAPRHTCRGKCGPCGGIIMTWGLLTPVVISGQQSATCSSPIQRIEAPLPAADHLSLAGMAFLLLYYLSDEPYLAYTRGRRHGGCRPVSRKSTPCDAAHDLRGLFMISSCQRR